MFSLMLYANTYFWGTVVSFSQEEKRKKATEIWKMSRIIVLEIQCNFAFFESGF